MLRQFRFLHRASSGSGSGSSKTNDKHKKMEKKRDREIARERERGGLGLESGREDELELKACQPGSTFCIMMNDDDASTTSMMCVRVALQVSFLTPSPPASSSTLLLATSRWLCVDLFMRPQLLQQWQKNDSILLCAATGECERTRAAQRCRLASQLETNYAQSGTQLSKCLLDGRRGSRRCMGSHG